MDIPDKTYDLSIILFCLCNGLSSDLDPASLWVVAIDTAKLTINCILMTLQHRKELFLVFPWKITVQDLFFGIFYIPQTIHFPAVYDLQCISFFTVCKKQVIGTFYCDPVTLFFFTELMFCADLTFCQIFNHLMQLIYFLDTGRRKLF